MEVGELEADEIHCPGIYVNRIIKGIREQKRIEKLALKMGGSVSIAAKTEEERD